MSPDHPHPITISFPSCSHPSQSHIAWQLQEDTAPGRLYLPISPPFITSLSAGSTHSCLTPLASSPFFAPRQLWVGATFLNHSLAFLPRLTSKLAAPSQRYTHRRLSAPSTLRKDLGTGFLLRRLILCDQGWFFSASQEMAQHCPSPPLLPTQKNLTSRGHFVAFCHVGQSPSPPC